MLRPSTLQQRMSSGGRPTASGVVPVSHNDKPEACVNPHLRVPMLAGSQTWDSARSRELSCARSKRRSCLERFVLTQRSGGTAITRVPKTLNSGIGPLFLPYDQDLNLPRLCGGKVEPLCGWIERHSLRLRCGLDRVNRSVMIRRILMKNVDGPIAV